MTYGGECFCGAVKTEVAIGGDVFRPRDHQKTEPSQRQDCAKCSGETVAA
jgi:hypothetical protein